MARSRPTMEETAIRVMQMLTERTRSRPVGVRQRRILSIMQRRRRHGKHLTTTSLLADELGSTSIDVYGSLLGLAQRGLVDATQRCKTHKGMRNDDWRLTDTGRTA